MSEETHTHSRLTNGMSVAIFMQHGREHEIREWVAKCDSIADLQEGIAHNVRFPTFSDLMAQRISAIQGASNGQKIEKLILPPMYKDPRFLIPLIVSGVSLAVAFLK